MRKDVESIYIYHLLFTLIILILCILIYSNTFNAPFIFDDLPHIKENPFFRLNHIDFQRLWDAGFKSPNPSRPLANISYALNYYFGKYDVRGYHVINIIIHFINGILVYFLSLYTLRRVSGYSTQNRQQVSSVSNAFISFFTALVFITHPIQTQSVTYIDQRMTSMAVMFYLLSLLFYIMGRLSLKKLNRGILFFCSFVSWVMALGSKEIAATLPLIILIYEWYFFQDIRMKWLRRNIKYFLGIMIVLGLVAFISLGKRPIDQFWGFYAIRDFTVWERVLTQFRVIILYISLLFYPHPSRLNFLHSISTSHSLLEPVTTLLSLLVIITLIGFAILIARRQRLISFCILWFFINLAIESSVIGLEMIYEYRLYLPMIGFAILTINLVFGCLQKKKFWAILMASIIIIFLGTTTYVRNRVWQNGITFWSDVISKNPHSSRAHNNLGIALKMENRVEEAIVHYSEALRLNPDYEKPHNNLGNALYKQGRIDDAIDHFLGALRLKPFYWEAHFNLGKALDEMGRTEEAIDHYLQALRLRPYHAEIHNNLGIALKKQDRAEEAIKHYVRALQLEPDYEKAHYNLGNALYKQGHIDEAIDHFLQALEIKPDYAEAYYNLGIALYQKGRMEEAIDHYLKALRFKPDYEEAHNNLGIALFHKGDTRGAIEHFREAVRIKPDYVGAKNNLKKALLILKKKK